jgi:hypothetical protein
LGFQLKTVKAEESESSDSESSDMLHCVGPNCEDVLEDTSAGCSNQGALTYMLPNCSMAAMPCVVSEIIPAVGSAWMSSVEVGNCTTPEAHETSLFLFGTPFIAEDDPCISVDHLRPFCANHARAEEVANCTTPEAQHIGVAHQATPLLFSAPLSAEGNPCIVVDQFAPSCANDVCAEGGVALQTPSPEALWRALSPSALADDNWVASASKFTFVFSCLPQSISNATQNQGVDMTLPSPAVTASPLWTPKQIVEEPKKVLSLIDLL